MDDHELHLGFGKHGATLDAILERLDKIDHRLNSMESRGRISVAGVASIIAATGILIALIVEPRINAKVNPIETEIQSLRRDNGTMQRQLEVMNQRGPFKAP